VKKEIAVYFIINLEDTEASCSVSNSCRIVGISCFSRRGCLVTLCHRKKLFATVLVDGFLPQLKIIYLRNLFFFIFSLGVADFFGSGLWFHNNYLLDF
jgi:hypothetical protein